MEYAIQTKNLSVNLGKNYKAIQDITVNIRSNQIIGIIGPSGAGKTTLIRAIAGRQRITSGELRVLGLPAGSKQLRKNLTYMTQQLSVYADLTVRENLMYFARMAGIGRKETSQTVISILEKVDLLDCSKALVSQLSGGQRQRVSLAVALIGNPSLMVLDEPTVGLDPILREQLWELLKKIASHDTTVIISSHVMDEAARCDDLLLLRGGKLLAHDNPKTICTHTRSATIEQAFITLVSPRK